METPLHLIDTRRCTLLLLASFILLYFETRCSPRKQEALGSAAKDVWRKKLRIDELQEVNPNVANLCRGKTRQGAPDVASRRLGQVEAYLTVREVLAGASKGPDGVLWREFCGFGRFRFATLGLSQNPKANGPGGLSVTILPPYKILGRLGFKFHREFYVNSGLTRLLRNCNGVSAFICLKRQWTWFRFYGPPQIYFKLDSVNSVMKYHSWAGLQVSRFPKT